METEALEHLVHSGASVVDRQPGEGPLAAQEALGRVLDCGCGVWVRHDAGSWMTRRDGMI